PFSEKGAGAAREESERLRPLFTQSGRQDSNLRPLGPEGAPGISDASTGVQALATTQVAQGDSDAPTPAGRSGTLGRVPPCPPLQASVLCRSNCSTSERSVSGSGSRGPRSMRSAIAASSHTFAFPTPSASGWRISTHSFDEVAPEVPSRGRPLAQERPASPW